MVIMAIYMDMIDSMRIAITHVVLLDASEHRRKC
jgi:hypothetical protein